VIQTSAVQALEAGYVWDERTRTTSGGKAIVVPLKDGWFEHVMNCGEYTELNFGQGQQTGCKLADPGFVSAGQGQGQRERQWHGAAGGQIAEVHGQSLVAQQARVHIGKEVAALDQHVAGDGQLHAGGRGQQRAIVAHAKGGATYGALEIAADQIEFTHEVSGRPQCCGLVSRWSAAVDGQGQKKLSGLRQKRWRMAL
jgi:hypothetical protein